MTQDPYSVLGVERGATDEQIRTAYRKLARELHPDVNPNDSAAEERFKEVSSAYDILSDKKKRDLFDEFGHDGLKSGFDAGQARNYQQWAQGFGAQGFRGPGGGFRVDMSGGGPNVEGFDLGDIFGDIFAGGAGQARMRRGQDVLVKVQIDLDQALNGADVQVAVSGRATPVRVRIPQGADTGSRLRVEGQGQPGAGGGPPGDLVIETVLTPHPFFRRSGLDLNLSLPVTLAEAYRGASVEVPTPSGNVKLRIPPGSQNGTKLRLKGKGVSKGCRQGDLFVILELRLPETQDSRLIESLEAAERLYPDLRRDIRL